MSGRVVHRAVQMARRRSAQWGAHEPDDFGTLSQFDTLVTAVGREPTICHAFHQNAPTFFQSAWDAVIARGCTPLETYEPWAGSITDSSWTLASIINGSHDATFSAWATSLGTWGQPIFFRTMHEMNGNWYSWDEGVNGNTTGQYVQAWQHMHTLMAPLMPNAKWVWCPNVTTNTAALSGFYPGDAYVDWLGLDGYNYSTTVTGGVWQSFSDLYDASITTLLGIAPTKPLMICEIGCTEYGGDKAQWITDMFTYLDDRPVVQALVWYDQQGADARNNWSVTSSTTAQAAFGAGITTKRWFGALM